jgi:hypothetical protein
MQYPNFYENVKEAQIRLAQTVVLYDGEPYFVLCFDDHKPDGIIRIYMDKLSSSMEIFKSSVPHECALVPGRRRGDVMDEFILKNPQTSIIRKHMNSPLFQRFRPFPLGMCNQKTGGGGVATFCERNPTRQTQQGLMNNMIQSRRVGMQPGQGSINLFSDEFRDCIMGRYPSVKDCIKVMSSSDYTDQSVAFDRKFAFVRGPVGMVFLAYQSDVVGALPNGDLSVVKLSKEFSFTKEVVDKLGIFEDIRV